MEIFLDLSPLVTVLLRLFRLIIHFAEWMWIANRLFDHFECFSHGFIPFPKLSQREPCQQASLLPSPLPSMASIPLMIYNSKTTVTKNHSKFLKSVCGSAVSGRRETAPKDCAGARYTPLRAKLKTPERHSFSVLAETSSKPARS
jgi:hypothetical protein